MIAQMIRGPKIALSFAILLLVATVASTSLIVLHRTHKEAQPSETKHAPHVGFLGVVTPTPTAADLRIFAETTDVEPNLDEYYIPWGFPFNRTTASEIASKGALPMISWEPFTRATTLADIALGEQDAYINSWAHAIAAYHYKIAISFAAEMNGPWEDWGPTHATAAQFVSAWRKIHDLFAQAGATNVTWVWTVNQINGVKAPLRPYWPGASYVNWIGIDGYWWGPDSSAGLTFSSIFKSTLTEVRQFTNGPTLIAETGGAPGYKLTAVNDLFYGVEHTPGMLGFVWFNVNTRAADWRLQDSPTAITAYRSEAKMANFTGRHAPTLAPRLDCRASREKRYFTAPVALALLWIIESISSSRYRICVNL